MILQKHLDSLRVKVSLAPVLVLVNVSFLSASMMKGLSTSLADPKLCAIGQEIYDEYRYQGY
jgi:hypothetical protein